MYRALANDPDLEVRSEARFRMGGLLTRLGREPEAARAYRAILDEKPNATRVRFELARLLERMGDEAEARRELRQVRAVPLPADVAMFVDRFADALRSRKPIGGSFEIGFAPNSNINRATDARILETVIAPLTLDDAARAQSGVGVEGSGQAYLRWPLSDEVNVVPRVSGEGEFYRKSEFDDVSVSAQAGIEWHAGKDRITPSAGRTWRWFGGKPYATTDTLSAAWVHSLGPRAQLTLRGGAGQASYKFNRLQSGGLYNVSATAEFAVSARTGVGGSLGATRQSARDPGYATTSGYVSLFGWREAGPMTVYASSTLRRTLGDARLFLFDDRRREWFASVSGGVTLRQLAVAEFAPFVRVTLERNFSTVGIYDYRRMKAQVGLTRAF